MSAPALGEGTKHQCGFGLEVGGLVLNISSPMPVDLSTDPGDAYGRFLGSPEGAASKDEIDVRLLPGAGPGTSGLLKRFDSGQSWSMFEHPGGRLLELIPPGALQPLWRMLLNSDLSQATVYCGDISDNPSMPGFMANPMRYPLDQLLVMFALLRRRGALVHAAAVVAGNRAYLLPGRSGAGKSTITGLLAGSAAQDVLSDDRVVLRQADDGAFNAYGTPWPGEGGYASPSSAPLGGILVLKQGDRNALARVSPVLARDVLLGTLSVPWFEKEEVALALEFIEGLLNAVPVYEFTFTREGGAEDVFRRFIHSR